MTEWPLVVFTISLQLSCGITLATIFVDHQLRNSVDASVRPLGISIFPITALGLLASLLHLGRPLTAYRALYNLGHSRLSLEVFLTALFAISAFLYSMTWWKRIRTGRPVLGIVTALLGLAATASSSAIYLVPTQPAWNSGWLPFSFLATTLLLGCFASLAFTDANGIKSARLILLASGVTGSLLSVVTTLWMLAHIARNMHDKVAAAHFQQALQATNTATYWTLLGAYLLLTGILPIAFAFRSWPRRRAASETGALHPGFTLLFVLVLLGAVLGRLLMYRLGVPVQF